MYTNVIQWFIFRLSSSEAFSPDKSARKKQRTSIKKMGDASFEKNSQRENSKNSIFKIKA